MVNSLPPRSTDRPIDGLSPSILPARPDEAAALSALAIRSKGHWGYDAEFLEACRDELTVDPDRIDSPAHRMAVARIGQVIAGYYSLERLGPQRWELNALFVDPAFIRRGIGSQLLAHALGGAQASGARSVKVQSDPDAELFYRRAGAIPVGFEPSGSIAGRELPVLEFRLGRRP